MNLLTVFLTTLLLQQAVFAQTYSCRSSCPNGTMDSQSKCSGNGRSNCRSCNAGYYLTNKLTAGLPAGTRCDAYSCRSSCPNGTMDSQSKCSGNGRSNCRSCNAGYYLSDKLTAGLPAGTRCDAYNCKTCAYGTQGAQSTCARDNGDNCNRCNAGYINRDKQCVAMECKCSNGVIGVQSKCTWDGRENCSECNEGYKLTSYDITSLSLVIYTCVREPTAEPTAIPTAQPTPLPTDRPTTAFPTAFPTASPTTAVPTAFPTDSPTTASPTHMPTPVPTVRPTPIPTVSPTPKPSAQPTSEPTTCDWLYERVAELTAEVAELRLENRALKTRLATPIAQTCECDSAATKGDSAATKAPEGTNTGTNTNPSKGCPVYVNAKDCKKKSKKKGLKCEWNKQVKLCTKKDKNTKKNKED